MNAQITKDTKEDIWNNARQAAHAYIAKYANQGAYPYLPGREAALEASAWCAIALRSDREQNELSVKKLLAWQHKDGGWSTESQIAKDDWSSSLAVLALRLLSEGPSAPVPTDEIAKQLRRATESLLDARTEFYGTTARLAIFLKFLMVTHDRNDLEYGRGWPWNKGCFHWIEPTSYALLALKLPQRTEIESFQKMVTLAEKFILNHTCDGGGWNHGNNISIGTHLPAFAVTTAEALLALQGSKESESIKQGKKYLVDSVSENQSALCLAWSVLAFDAYGMQTANALKLLIKRQNKDGSFGLGGNLMTTALALLALDTQKGLNPLKMQIR